ncbi:MAG TPA: thiamine pyrophosphate-dependent enzyme [Thermodesulfobacteriota bacterium]|nr:thiamine pyrophosphate-dependent enzyme [Thermodesulfobacteriota bacterium]
MDTKWFDMGEIDIAWCPGCGNLAILNALKQALSELEIKPEKLVVVSGIGQAAKAPHYYKCNLFNGLHGRSLPVATAIKAAHPQLIVIDESGDGCMYGEGGNHFIHGIRRNPDITNIVHDNMVYGLTKGQASPTSLQGFKTPVQRDGVFQEAFNPIALAISLGASFVARAFAGDTTQTKDILKKAISHKGYALVDILQPCVTYNKLNTYQWFKTNTYYIDTSHDPYDRMEAFRKALEVEKLPLGVFYLNPKLTFEERLSVYQENRDPLYTRTPDFDKLSEWIHSKRGI